MNKAETVAGLVFTALGVFMFVESWKTPYLLEGVPGPSFLPRWIAGGLVATGLFLTLRAALPRFALKDATDWPNRRGWARVCLMLGALAVAVALYLVFAVWLRVPLPKGILEFLG